jgi:hypothetical protein
LCSNFVFRFSLPIRFFFIFFVFFSVSLNQQRLKRKIFCYTPTLFQDAARGFTLLFCCVRWPCPS